MAVTLSVDGVTYPAAATGSGAAGPLAAPNAITYQTTAPSGGTQQLQIYRGGALWMSLTFATADATALAQALGPSGAAAASAAKLP